MEKKYRLWHPRNPFKVWVWLSPEHWSAVRQTLLEAEDYAESSREILDTFLQCPECFDAFAWRGLRTIQETFAPKDRPWLIFCISTNFCDPQTHDVLRVTNLTLKERLELGINPAAFEVIPPPKRG